MSAQDLAQFVEQYHRSVDAFVQGDPEPSKRLYSRGDDATLANPISPPMRGWNQIEGAIDRAAAQLREGERCTWELEPEREWSVSMKPDDLPTPWCYPGRDCFAPAVKDLRRA